MHDRTTKTLAASLLATAGWNTCIAGEAPTPLPVSGYSTPHGYVYVNMATGERIVSRTSDTHIVARGAQWSWDNSVIDPCAPSPETPRSIAIFTGIMNDDEGDAGTPDAVNYWQDWFEHPGDSVINAITFGYFSQIHDPGEDGVEGAEFLMVFTENDSPDTRSAAIAHSPIIVGNLMGAEDDGANGAAVAGDGIIDFAEGNYWIAFIDLGSCVPCLNGCAGTAIDVEVGDTNGVSDSELGPSSNFSGIPGTDTDGDGLINSGFVVGFRQPGVAEGDGLIDRFPELAGSGIENPDGYDPQTFANIVPMGNPLVAPSKNLESYVRNSPTQVEWPFNDQYIPTPGEAIGAIDGFGFINTEGTDTGVYTFGGFGCDLAAISAPYYLSPWSGWDIRLGVEYPGGVVIENPADIVEPFGVLDLADLNAFIVAFQTGDPTADLVPPVCVLDLADITTFVTSFLAGGP